MSDTTRCLTAPNYNHSTQFVLQPCAAVPEQNFSMPSAGQTLAMYVGPLAGNKIVDLWQFNLTSSAPVVVSAACLASWSFLQN
jgi:hypothetical protein